MTPGAVRDAIAKGKLAAVRSAPDCSSSPTSRSRRIGGRTGIGAASTRGGAPRAVRRTTRGMGDAPARRVFRVVHTNPPTRSDFVSNNAEAGIVPRRALSAVERRLWRGVSCTETLVQARATARRIPMLGTFVAALDLPVTPTFPR